MDGDNDIDVISASMDDNKISIYENDGEQNFSEIIISNNAIIAYNAMGIDIDNDGDNDILSASGGDNKISWYENIVEGCTNENSCNYNLNAEFDNESCIMIQDFNGNAFQSDTIQFQTADESPPLLQTSGLASTNQYVFLDFTEGLYSEDSGTGSIELNDITHFFDNNDGNCTSVSII